jgi:ankyrin repeat protein
LAECLSLNELRKALASLPITLDDTYARILCNIHEKHSQYALKILEWLTYSARPLRIEEVAEVITVNIEGSPRFDPERRFLEPQDILIICSGLVTTTGGIKESSHDNTTAEQVRLAHFSVKEYLVSDRIQAGPAAQYSIQEIHAKVSMAETCLAYLLHFNKPNSLTSQTIKEFPLARYAAKYWTEHAQVATKDTGAINLSSMQLFQSGEDAYINWIRLFDLDWQTEPDITRSLESVASPLYYASLTGLMEPARLLLEGGADVNAVGGFSDTALVAASLNGTARSCSYCSKQAPTSTWIECTAAHSRQLQPKATTRLYSYYLRQAPTSIMNMEESTGTRCRRLRQTATTKSCSGCSNTGPTLIRREVFIIPHCRRLHSKDTTRLCSYCLRQAPTSTQMENTTPTHCTRLQLVATSTWSSSYLRGGANVDAEEGKANALYSASIGGHNQIVKQLLKYGFDVNIEGGWFGNALQAASYKGHDQIVQQLLKEGADVNTKVGYCGNALQAASYYGHNQIVQLLLKEGADVNAPGGYHGEVDESHRTYRQFLEDPNMPEWDGNALYVASIRGHDQIVQLLLEAGADVNAKGGRFDNALQAAAYSGHDKIVQRLLKEGANVNAEGGRGGNALQTASHNGHIRVVQELLHAGADTNGYALQAASLKGHDQTVRLLLEAGADVDADGGEYGSALQAASLKGHDQIVQLLLEAGTDVDVGGEFHGTAPEAAEAGEAGKPGQKRKAIHGGDRDTSTADKRIFTEADLQERVRVALLEQQEQYERHFAEAEVQEQVKYRNT